MLLQVQLCANELVPPPDGTALPGTWNRDSECRDLNPYWFKESWYVVSARQDQDEYNANASAWTLEERGTPLEQNDRVHVSARTRKVGYSRAATKLSELRPP
jgi:hypothetical protein